MTHFTDDCTEGFTAQELQLMNDEVDERLKGLLDYKHICEQVLVSFLIKKLIV